MTEKREELLNKLNLAKVEGGGNVTYMYENGTKQRQPINQSIFYNEKRKEKSPDEVLNIFSSTMNDLGAISFEL